MCENEKTTIEIVRAEDAAAVVGAQSADSIYQWYEKLLQLEMVGFNICRVSKGEGKDEIS